MGQSVRRPMAYSLVNRGVPHGFINGLRQGMFHGGCPWDTPWLATGSPMVCTMGYPINADHWKLLANTLGNGNWSARSKDFDTTLGCGRGSGHCPLLSF